jgi:hypothetical protein
MRKGGALLRRTAEGDCPHVVSGNFEVHEGDARAYIRGYNSRSVSEGDSWVFKAGLRW